MAHVQLTTGPDGAKVLVDGTDITRAVLHEGFSIVSTYDGKMLVSLTIVADRVDVDLPDAVIAAMSKDVD